MVEGNVDWKKTQEIGWHWFEGLQKLLSLTVTNFDWWQKINLAGAQAIWVLSFGRLSKL